MIFIVGGEPTIHDWLTSKAGEEVNDKCNALHTFDFKATGAAHDVIELLSALQDFRVAARDFNQEVEQPFSRYAAPLERLRATIDSLGQVKPAKQVRVPEDYIQQWKEFLTRKRERLESRAGRYLCWEPDVVTDARFQDYLD